MKIDYKVILGVCILIISFNYINIQREKRNVVLNAEKTEALRKYAVNIEEGGKELVIILNNSDRIKEGKYTEFIDRVVITKTTEILKGNNYSILTLNLPCLNDIECLNKYYEISKLTVSLKPKAVIFNTPSSGLNTDIIDKALTTANIPIYIYQTESAVNYELYVGPDNKGLGQQAAEGIKKLASTKDQVLYVETVRLINNNTLDNGYKRINGAREILDFNGIKEYGTIFSEWSKTKTYTEILNLLSSKSTENLKFIITPSVETAEGAVLAIEKLGLEKQIKIICLDITETSIKLLNEGKLEGLVGQELLKQGELLGESIIKDSKEGKPKQDKRQVLFNSIYLNRSSIQNYKQLTGEYNY